MYYWVSTWQQDGATAQMHDDLRGQVRVVAGCSPAPTATIIDSQSVKGSEMVARAGRGYDAAKKINGTKHHLAVDVVGLLLTVLVTDASVQDRDAARPLLWNLCRAFPSIKLAARPALRREVREFTNTEGSNWILSQRVRGIRRTAGQCLGCGLCWVAGVAAGSVFPVSLHGGRASDPHQPV